MRWWFVVGLFCLCVLFYYGINNYGIRTKHQSVVNESAKVELLVRHRSVERMASEVVLPVKEDLSFPDNVDVDLIEVNRIAEQTPVTVGEHPDPDIDPEMFDTTKLSHQKNVGVLLDADGEPGDQTSAGTLPQRNVGAFLDVDGNDVDSGFVLNKGSKAVNVGEFIDPDGLE